MGRDGGDFKFLSNNNPFFFFCHDVRKVDPRFPNSRDNKTTDSQVDWKMGSHYPSSVEYAAWFFSLSAGPWFRSLQLLVGFSSDEEGKREE